MGTKLHKVVYATKSKDKRSTQYISHKFYRPMDRVEKLQTMLVESPADDFLEHALALEWIKLGEDEKARILFEHILNRNPNYTGSYYHLGKLLERQGQHDQAAVVYQTGMQMTKKSEEHRAFQELKSALEELEED